MAWQLLRYTLVLTVLLRGARCDEPNVDYFRPDLSTTIESERGDFQLDAFKATGNDLVLQSDGAPRLLQLQWFSLGEPQLVGSRDARNRSKETFFEFKPKHVGVAISTLLESDKTALAVAARAKYGEGISERQFSQLPLARVDCQLAMDADSGEQLLLTGSASQLKTHPIRVDFVAAKSYPARQLLERLVRNEELDKVKLNCTFAAKRSSSRTAVFQLLSERVDKLGVVEKLFNASDMVYVTRGQLTKLAAEFYVALGVAERYALTKQQFSEAFIDGLLQETVDDSFSDVDIDDALPSLSRYAFKLHDTLSSDLKTALSAVFSVKSSGNRKQIVVDQLAVQSLSHRLQDTLSTAIVLFGIRSKSDKDQQLIGSGVKLPPNDIVFHAGSLDSQLAELNALPVSAVFWKLEGGHVVPAKLHVAELWRTSFNQPLRFDHVFRDEADVPFSRMFGLDVASATGGTSPWKSAKKATQPAYQETAQPEQSHQEQQEQLSKLKAILESLTLQMRQQQQEQQKQAAATLEAGFERLSKEMDKLVQLRGTVRSNFGPTTCTCPSDVGTTASPPTEEQPYQISTTLSQQMVDFNASKYSGSPLHWASENGRTEAVKELLKEATNVDIRNIKGQTPLHLASMNGHVDAVNELLERGANMEAKDPSNHDFTPLHWACYKGRVSVVRALLDKGALINVAAGDRDHRNTPLHEASYFGHVDVVNLLLDRGADINARSSLNWTPLHYASLSGQIGIVKVLLDRGADVQAKDDQYWTALHKASGNGHVDVVKLLLDRGADIEAKDTKWGNATPLHVASYNGHLAVVKLLLDRGANVNAKSVKNETPLRYASLAGYIGCYVDQEQRDLSDSGTSGSSNTIEGCIQFCQSKGFTFAGVQNGDQCFCGSSYGKYGKAADGDCSSPCAGNSQQKCGGGWRNSIFHV